MWRMVNNSKIYIFSLFLILAVAGFFYFQNLGKDYITLWDEAVHVNVVKNLAADPWPPKLHLTDIGIDFQDWTNNYIWVHKPLLPLYLQSIFYKISPTLFAFRLPSAIFAMLSIIALFLMARRHFGYTAAIISASLFAFNSYVFELVKGRQFSGLHDLMFVFFGILALDKILSITNNSSKNLYIWFGVFTGLAYLSKGGLALLFIPALFILSLRADNWKQGILNLSYSVLIILLVILPEKLGFLLLFPAEFYFEQSLQVLHLFKDLEYWGRPWDFYLTVYLREILLPYLYLPVLVALAYSIAKAKTDRQVMVMVVWVLSFFIILSFGVSKISNFMFAALPALLILFSLMIKDLRNARSSAWLLAMSAVIILIYVSLRLDLWQIKSFWFHTETALQRFALFFFSGFIFFVSFLVLKLLENKIKLYPASKLAFVLAFILIIGTYARANQLMDKKNQKEGFPQKQIKEVAENVKNQYAKNSIFLINAPELLKAHLYFKYCQATMRLKYMTASQFL